MFTVTMLPAGRGDCLWIEYGSPDAPHVVVIDGGISSTERTLRARLERLPPGRRHIELIVVTHIDIDHIAGVLALLQDPVPGLTIGDVWFNGWKHLPEDPGELGAKQGEALSFTLERDGLPWNAAFAGGAVMIPADESLPQRTLAGGMRLTLLGPTPRRLHALRRAWAKEIEKAGLVPGEAGAILSGQDEVDEDDEGMLGEAMDLEAFAARAFKADTSPANGSSIALLAEHEGRRVLLAGDAYAGDVLAAVRRIAGETGDDLLEVAALKLSHHGGRKNTSAELLRALACRDYLFSTNGTIYRHPQAETVARILSHGREAGTPRLHFNYRCPRTLAWDDPALHARRFAYTPVYPEPAADAAGLVVDIG